VPFFYFETIQLGILNGASFFPSHNTLKFLVSIDESPYCLAFSPSYNTSFIEVGTNECITNLTFSHNQTQKSPSCGRWLKKPKKKFQQAFNDGVFKNIYGCKICQS
jgi:hypothetical protein